MQKPIQREKKWRSYIWLAVNVMLATALIMSAPSARAQDNMKVEKPNIVYVLVDNWGWGDIRHSAKIN